MGEKKTKSTGKTVAIAILSILLVGALGFIGYDKFIIKDIKTKQNKTTVTNKAIAKEECTEKEQKSKCSGTYYGEYSSTSPDGQITSNLKYTYVLNDDGTFTADFSGVSATKGVYTINDNTVSLTGQNETMGPREEYPIYSTSDYVIADDCSYILYNDETISFKLNRK